MVLFESLVAVGGVAAAAMFALSRCYEFKWSLSKPTWRSPVLQIEGCVSTRRARGTGRRLYFSAVLIGDPESKERAASAAEAAQRPSRGPSGPALSRAAAR